jgi:hypothetical protein
MLSPLVVRPLASKSGMFNWGNKYYPLLIRTFCDECIA